MDEQSALNILTALPVLKDMPQEARLHVAKVFIDVSDQIDLDDGEAMMREGYLAFESGYVLLQGDIRVEKSGEVLSEAAAPALLGEMAQLKSSDMRTATVTAKGHVTALQFDWGEFYTRLGTDTADAERAAFMSSMERLIWDRFGLQPLLALPLFRGLSDEIKLKACIDFPWITERAHLDDGDPIFKIQDRCQNAGYLILNGAAILTQAPGRERTFSAPNIIGIMPKPDPALTWTASAAAKGPLEILQFNWKTYVAKLQQRLTAEEQNALILAMRQNASEHFWH